MTTYKPPTEYQRDVESKHAGLQAVWLADEQVAIRSVNSGIETAWNCLNATGGIRYRYTKLWGVVQE